MMFESMPRRSIGSRSRYLATSVVIIGLLLPPAFGCGPRPPARSRPQDRHELTGSLRDPIPLEPLHMAATRDRERMVITTYDASGLFEQASSAFRAGDFHAALDLYTRLVSEFTDSFLVPPALYNGALSRERLGDFEGASRDYLRLADGHVDSPDVTDALFRAAGALEKLEAWDDVTGIFERILAERDDLGAVDRIEALARRGVSLLAAGKPREARSSLEDATVLYRSGRGITPTSPTFHYAMAQFKLGEIIHAKMRAVELSADEAVLEEALERKCSLLLDAQAEYTRVIEIGHPHWAAAAAYRIGGLYHNLWDDMLAAPTPEDQSEEEREIYLELLRKRLLVLLTKAVTQWERTLKMIRRLEMEGEWAERTARDLEEIRELIVAEDEVLADVPDIWRRGD